MAANRPTIVYVSMLAASVLGLWLILTGGRHLTPVPNVGGEWVLTSFENVVPPASASMRIEQSGLFCQVVFQNGPAAGYRVTEGQSPGRVEMKSSQMTCVFDGPDTPDTTRLTIDGGASGHQVWKIHRVETASAASESK